jgi:hypothetical protein
MPYVKQNYRKLVDDTIDDLCMTILENVPIEKVDGVANYIITRIVITLLNKNSYSSMSDIIKTLECSKLEIYRRLIVPYEKKAAEKNGDLEEFL